LIYWAPLLHFYQPPIQVHWVLNKVCHESYRPLVQLFKDLPYAKVTVNINGVLTEMLDEHGLSDVVSGLRGLAEKGQLEFTGSGKYHPILPLIPTEEMRRQILQNFQTNRRFFGDVYDPKGFFSPEMCYSRDILEPVMETGHEWLILSGVACPVQWPMDVIHQVALEDTSIAVLFRDDILSNRISFQSIDSKGFVEHLRRLHQDGGDTYVVTAMDAETFGHHIQNWEKLFLAEVYEALEPSKVTREAVVPPRQPGRLAQQHGRLLRSRAAVETQEIRVVTISELVKAFRQGSVIEPRDSSWSTMDGDLKDGNPYPLWRGKGNRIHELQWRHVKLTIELVNKAVKVSDTDNSKYYSSIARALLDRSLHSCQFWWASRRPMWDINLVNRGLAQQFEVILNAYKAISVSTISQEEKTECYDKVIVARDTADRIKEQLFTE